MDIQRAKQILNSREQIEVLYQGTPVWIENVKDNNNVEVSYLDTSNRIEVQVNNLEENNNLLANKKSGNIP